MAPGNIKSGLSVCRKDSLIHVLNDRWYLRMLCNMIFGYHIAMSLASYYLNQWYFSPQWRYQWRMKWITVVIQSKAFLPISNKFNWLCSILLLRVQIAHVSYGASNYPIFSWALHPSGLVHHLITQSSSHANRQWNWPVKNSGNSYR